MPYQSPTPAAICWCFRQSSHEGTPCCHFLVICSSRFLYTTSVAVSIFSISPPQQAHFQGGQWSSLRFSTRIRVISYPALVSSFSPEFPFLDSRVLVSVHPPGSD